MNWRPQLRLKQRRRLMMGGDVLAVLLSVYLALALQALSSRRDFTFEYVARQGFWFLFFAGVWLVLANANDLYLLQTHWRPTRILLRLTRVTLQILLLYTFVFFLAERNELPRLFMLYFGLVSTLLIALWRLLWAHAKWLGQRATALANSGRRPGRATHLRGDRATGLGFLHRRRCARPGRHWR